VQRWRLRGSSLHPEYRDAWSSTPRTQPVPASAPPLAPPNPAARRARIPGRLRCSNPQQGIGQGARGQGARATQHVLSSRTGSRVSHTPPFHVRAAPSARLTPPLPRTRVARPTPHPLVPYVTTTRALSSRSHRLCPPLLIVPNRYPISTARSLPHAPGRVGNRVSVPSHATDSLLRLSPIPWAVVWPGCAPDHSPSGPGMPVKLLRPPPGVPRGVSVRCIQTVTGTVGSVQPSAREGEDMSGFRRYIQLRAEAPAPYRTRGGYTDQLDVTGDRRVQLHPTPLPSPCLP